MSNKLKLPPDYVTEAMAPDAFAQFEREEKSASEEEGYLVQVIPRRIRGALHAEVRYSWPPPAPAAFGWLAIRHETGGAGSGTVSTGRDDKGGVSYGAFQLKSEPAGGRVREFLDNEGAAFANRFPQPPDWGGAEFALAWRQLAEDEPKALFDAELSYIIRTHYEPQVKRIENETALKLDGRSAALREVVLSTAIQHGPDTTVITTAIAKLGAVPDEGVAYDRQLIEAIYDERTRRFAKTASRYAHEAQDALAALDAEAAGLPAATPAAALELDDAERAEDPAWIRHAFDEYGLGVAENQNQELSERISNYFTFTTGGVPLPETTAWCGAFLAYCLTLAGAIQSRTGSAKASDWLDWGDDLEDDPRYGCVVVLKPQDAAQKTSGHVGFFLGQEGGHITIISGNTHNSVDIGTYPASEVRTGGYRWPVGWPR